MHRDVLALGDQELDRFGLVAVGVDVRSDLDPALVLVILAEFDATVHFRDDRAVLRTAGSKSSATRGRPPVMSRVLAPSVGIRAMTSPA